jgi:N,N'-diacetylchitobiose transport system substrate-binding protein
MPREMRMNVRIFAAAALVAALSVVAVGVSGASGGSAATTLTVWLQTDAQNGWPDLVAATNAQFEKDHPGVNVNVQYQQWTQHLAKFDATLAGGNAPDVIEMGNSEMAKYMFAGAFQDLSSSKSSFDNSNNWLGGLVKAGSIGGRLYGVPYYAASAVVTYRTDLFKKAGFAKPPTSLAQFTLLAKKLAAQNRQKGFSPVYISGPNWYVALGFVYDYGGQIARTSKGKWIGTLDSPKAIAGLTAYKRFFDVASRASKIQDEAHPFPYTVYAQGLVGAMPGAAWVTCCVGKYKAVSKQFAMPSRTPGQAMPGFLGGSNLAVPVGANKALATDWIKSFTDTGSEKALQAKGVTPNATNLLGNSTGDRAASRNWFVPVAKNWVTVENGNVLRTMLTQILTGQQTVKQAATFASQNITSTLNG